MNFMKDVVEVVLLKGSSAERLELTAWALKLPCCLLVAWTDPDAIEFDTAGPGTDSLIYSYLCDTVYFIVMKCI